jgi:hypothetical protein
LYFHWDLYLYPKTINLIMASWSFYSILRFLFLNPKSSNSLWPTCKKVDLFIIHTIVTCIRERKIVRNQLRQWGQDVFSAMKWKYAFNMSRENKEFPCWKTFSACCNKYSWGREWCVRLHCLLLWLYWFHRRLAQVRWNKIIITAYSSVSLH